MIGILIIYVKTMYALEALDAAVCSNFWSLQGPSIFSLFCRLFLVLICIPFAFVG